MGTQVMTVNILTSVSHRPHACNSQFVVAANTVIKKWNHAEMVRLPHHRRAGCQPTGASVLVLRLCTPRRGARSGRLGGTRIPTKISMGARANEIRFPKRKFVFLTALSAIFASKRSQKAQKNLSKPLDFFEMDSRFLPGLRA